MPFSNVAARLFRFYRSTFALVSMVISATDTLPASSPYLEGAPKCEYTTGCLLNEVFWAVAMEAVDSVLKLRIDCSVSCAWNTYG